MTWKVPYINYPAQFKNMEKEIMDTIYDVLSRGDLMLRQQLRDFETNLAAFVGTKYAVGVSNCTDALHLIFRAAGVGIGDEVITVSHTFVATAEAIHFAGASPVFIDIDDDHNMNPDRIEAAITPRTKAIVPVHLNGRVCNMDKIFAIATKHNLLVIEDSAQALGASFKDTKGGAFGLAGAFSFYPAKILGAFGDAGAVTTNSKEIAEKVNSLRDHGRTPEGGNIGWSFNCRLDNLHAAILDIKLKRLPEWIERRREIAQIYDNLLSNVSGLKLPPKPRNDGKYYDAFQNYEIETQKRDQLVTHLRENGVEIMLPWGGKGVHQIESLGLPKYHLQRTEQLFRNVLMIPMHTELSDDQVRYVGETINEFFAIPSRSSVRKSAEFVT